MSESIHHVECRTLGGGICEQSPPMEAIGPVADHSELRIWRVSLEQIEATVAEFLGPGRVKGNRPGPAFSRVSMYLARHVSGWDYSKISRFNSRHQTTVIAAIRKIEKLRQKDEAVDALRRSWPISSVSSI